MVEKYLILAAGGQGRRLGYGVPKALISIGGIPLFIYSLRSFFQAARWSQVVIAVPQGLKAEFEVEISRFFPNNSNIVITVGGRERQDSVYNCLDYISALSPSRNAVVVVHDAARCLVSPKLIQSVLTKLEEHGALVPVIPPADTTVFSVLGEVKEVINRSNLRLVQTPQGFRFYSLWSAHKRAREEGKFFTDDGTLLHWYGEQVFCTEGERWNIKVTEPEDLSLANLFLTSSR